MNISHKPTVFIYPEDGDSRCLQHVVTLWSHQWSLIWQTWIYILKLLKLNLYAGNLSQPRVL